MSQALPAYRWACHNQPFWCLMKARTVFVLKEGVLRRGIPIGVIVTVLYIVTNLEEGNFDSGWARAAALIALCFLEWGIGAGWIIGSALWSRRQHRSNRDSLPPR